MNESGDFDCRKILDEWSRNRDSPEPTASAKPFPVTLRSVFRLEIDGQSQGISDRLSVAMVFSLVSSLPLI
jgi:hypothetical protein